MTENTEMHIFHAVDVLYPKKRAARKVVPELEHPRALQEALGGDLVDVGLTYGDSEHLERNTHLRHEWRMYSPEALLGGGGGFLH